MSNQNSGDAPFNYSRSHIQASGESASPTTTGDPAIAPVLSLLTNAIE